MSFSAQIGQLAADTGLLGVLLVLSITLFIFFHMVRIVYTLVTGIFKDLFQLYTEWDTESLENFHPYTRSILTNRCPEFALIATLKKQPPTRQVKEQLRELVQSVIDTLEQNESEPVKHVIIAQLRGIK